jgi:hypothetical protein
MKVLYEYSFPIIVKCTLIFYDSKDLLHKQAIEIQGGYGWLINQMKWNFFDVIESYFHNLSRQLQISLRNWMLIYDLTL